MFLQLVLLGLTRIFKVSREKPLRVANFSERCSVLVKIMTHSPAVRFEIHSTPTEGGRL